MGDPLDPSARSLAALFAQLFGTTLPARFEFYDGSVLGSQDEAIRISFTNRSAIRHLFCRPPELGFGRAYVAGDVIVEGDLDAAIALRESLRSPRPTPETIVAAARLLAKVGVRRPGRPAEEFRPDGRRHSLRRDAAAISHHYDVSNEFYELLLGPSMTYSCALFATGGETLEAAQAAKHELVCDKLHVRPGMRLLDIGCGWGALVRHAAARHGARAVGVTLAAEQARYATERARSEGLEDLVEFRHGDYRLVDDGPYDAIASVGMFEHVGTTEARTYFAKLAGLLAPGGRLLNHAIAQPTPTKSNTFVDRYVFPDGELGEVGATITSMHGAGLEVRHLEGMREHYVQTIRAWRDNLENRWAEAVALIGPGKARVWRLYLAGMNPGFASGFLQVHQVLAVKSASGPLEFESPAWPTRSLPDEPLERQHVRTEVEAMSQG